MFLTNHHKIIYVSLLTICELISQLNEIDNKANEMYELLGKKMKERQRITEALKTEDQMKWDTAMNNIRNVADEIILNELINI